MHDFSFSFTRKVGLPAVSPLGAGDLSVKLTGQLSDKVGVLPSQQRQPLLVPEAPVRGGQEALVKCHHSFQLDLLSVKMAPPHLVQIHEDYACVESLEFARLTHLCVGVEGSEASCCEVIVRTLI